MCSETIPFASRNQVSPPCRNTTNHRESEYDGIAGENALLAVRERTPAVSIQRKALPGAMKRSGRFEIFRGFGGMSVRCALVLVETMDVQQLIFCRPVLAQIALAHWVVLAQQDVNRAAWARTGRRMLVASLELVSVLRGEERSSGACTACVLVGARHRRCVNIVLKWIAEFDGMIPTQRERRFLQRVVQLKAQSTVPLGGYPTEDASEYMESETLTNRDRHSTCAYRARAVLMICARR
jgi:hypothetical protein